jgi:hypothetical protein
LKIKYLNNYLLELKKMDFFCAEIIEERGVRARLFVGATLRGRPKRQSANGN